MSNSSFVKDSTLVSLVTLISLSGVCISVPSHAQVINGGLETGEFDGYQTIGNTSIQLSAFSSGPAEGNFRALITNGVGSASTSSLEAFLELTPESINRGATEGSAIIQTFTANAGDVLTFDFNFLTNQSTLQSNFNDFSFVTINGSVSQLADTNSTFSSSPTGTFRAETGFQTFSSTVPTTGTLTLGLGVTDMNAQTVNSGLLVDKISLQSNSSLIAEPIPEPSSILGLLIFGAFGAKAMLKRKQYSMKSK